MKSLAKSLFLSALAFPLLLAGCDAELATATKFRSKIDGYAIDLNGAIDLASGVVEGGVVIDAEYDDDRWEVEVVAGETRTRVKVHPMTGVTGILSERPASAEELAAAELVANAPTSFSQALTAAKVAAPGALPYEIKADGGMFEVDLVDEKSFLDAEVDPFDGECGEVEEDDDEDPEQDDEEDDDEGEEDNEDEGEDDGENDGDECVPGEECTEGDGEGDGGEGDGDCEPNADGSCSGGDEGEDPACPDGSENCGGDGGTEPGECDPNAEGDCPSGDGGEEPICPDGSENCNGGDGGTDPGGECDPATGVNCEGGGEDPVCPDGSTDCNAGDGGTDPGVCDPATGVNCEGNG